MKRKTPKLSYSQAALLIARILSKVWRTPVSVRFEKRNEFVRIVDARTDERQTDYSISLRVIGE
jgi:hypothetical protein